MKSVGISTSSAMTSQKSEKRAAATRERRRVPTANEKKIARGVKESRSWMNRKACRDQLAFNFKHL
jgi:hypothetical protein